MIFNQCGKIMKSKGSSIDKEKLEVVKEMKYLGIVFNSNCTFHSAIETLKTKVLKLCLNCLNLLKYHPWYQNIYSSIWLHDKTYIIIQLWNKGSHYL